MGILGILGLLPYTAHPPGLVSSLALVLSGYLTEITEVEYGIGFMTKRLLIVARVPRFLITV